MLDTLLAHPDRAAALAFYDDLPAVEVEEILGRWRGSGLPTGHPMDGLLERFGWHGKRFESAEAVHPLVFDAGGGRLVSVNPGWIPIGLLVRQPRLAHLPAARPAFAVLRRLLTTTTPRARLRMTRYRGVLTATMCYDTLPIHDAFRRVDHTTLLGAMDLRGSSEPFLFLLHRST